MKETPMKSGVISTHSQKTSETALLKVAAEKIYAEAVKEFHTDG